MDHLQPVGQDSSGCWELWPLVHHLPWKSVEKEERKQRLVVGWYFEECKTQNATNRVRPTVYYALTFYIEDI